ncbi:MAG TPA: sulfur carrier protein ThiS [Trebonia sp.]|jgi:sulfur carrier protein|nr:sulfur carrier protein ThiS [Trebonia sp.]
MKVLANGEPHAVPAGTTVADLVAALTGQQTGIAVALNGEVVPRRAWPARTLGEGDQVEVVTAVQGG